MSVAESLPTFNAISDVLGDVDDCWVDGVLYHRCGAGRRYQKKGAIPACGELKPFSTPYYHRNRNQPANAVGEQYATTCADCYNRDKRTKKAPREYTAETPRERAVVVFASTPQVETQVGAVQLGVEASGEQWFPVRPMLGLTRFDDESGLRRAIESDPLLCSTAAYAPQLAEDGKQREMLHLPWRMWVTLLTKFGNAATLPLQQAVQRVIEQAFGTTREEVGRSARAAIAHETQPGPPESTSAPVLPTVPEPTVPANDYAALLGHVTQTGESILTLRNHLSLTEQWLNNLPSVVEALEDQLESLRPLADAVKRRRNPLKHGWVYVLHDPVGRRYKIGMTQNPDPGKRKAEVEGQWGKGQSVQVVWIETDDIKLEKSIQAYYKQRRLHIREEWYRLSDEDVNRVRALGSFVSFKDFQPESLDVAVVVQGGLFGE